VNAGWSSQVTERRALFVATYSRSSPYRLGSHHICDELLRRGWQVTLITHPLGIATMLGSPREKLARLANVLRSNTGTEDSYMEYSRLQLFVPVNRPGLAGFGLGRWSCVGWPAVARILRQRLRAGGLDLLYMDNAYQPFWLDHVDAARFVYRLPDDPFGHGPLQGPLQRSLEWLIRHADATVCPSASTESAARQLGARRVLPISNGVDLAHFTGDKPRPEEYASIPGPIAVYLGACDARVDKRLLEAVALRVPEVTFVVVGDVRGDAFSRPMPENLLLLGSRPYDQIADYLVHADIGLLPFDTSDDNLLVQGTDPLKLYQYLAAGLPVVSTEIPAAQALAGMVALAPQEPGGFSVALRTQLQNPGVAPDPDWLARQDWCAKVDCLLGDLDLQ